MDMVGVVGHDELLAYCLAKPGAWEDWPWEDHVVAKVGPGERGKIFAFLGDGTSVGVKAARTGTRPTNGSTAIRTTPR